MSGAAPGREVGLYLDTRMPLDVGDEVVTAKTGRRYLVVKIRVQQRGVHVGRKHLRCVVLAPDAPRDPDSRVVRISWYARPRRR